MGDPKSKKFADGSVGFAQQHMDVIARFGRFPARDKEWRPGALGARYLLPQKASSCNLHLAIQNNRNVIYQEVAWGLPP